MDDGGANGSRLLDGVLVIFYYTIRDPYCTTHDGRKWARNSCNGTTEDTVILGCLMYRYDVDNKRPWWFILGGAVCGRQNDCIAQHAASGRRTTT
jgi:hypothetical protein